MRTIKIIPVLCVWAAFAILVLHSTQPSSAGTNTITIGPWTFDEADFADDATVLDSVRKIRIDSIENCTGFDFELGDTRFEECIDLALTGYTPEDFLFNVGLPSDTLSNWFQLDFIDVKAENHFGPDIVFFECHFSDYDYEIAVRPEGGVFTDFETFAASEFIDPDDPEGDDLCSDPFNVWGLQINLSDFGIGPDVIVDAIQFKVVDPDPLDPEIEGEGEPAMAAVLVNPITSPSIYLPFIGK